MPSVRAALCLAMLLAAPAVAADPTELGTFKSWTAFTATSASGKVCYALSKPTSTMPKKIARDAAYVIISVWPGRNVKDELQVVPGYTYKEGEPVFAQVGNLKTEFFTRNDGKAGSAWVKNVEDEAALVKAMRSGSTLTVTGVAKVGAGKKAKTTATTDTYSLSGIAGAIERARRECGK
jgi:hypothetical protein